MNTIKTGMLLAVLTALFVAVGGLLGGRNGMVMAFGFALIMNFVSYWYSDKIVLMTQGARELEPSEAPELFRMVERLTANAGLPMPRPWIALEEKAASALQPASPAQALTCLPC